MREADVGNHLSCDAVDMQDTVSRYVSGRLPEGEATAFEQHLESCERCWGEVQVALQVRDGNPQAGRTHKPAAPSRYRSPTQVVDRRRCQRRSCG